ncbi:DNA-binding transcriptional LysR family regulator [Actinomadura pelletieri DSM 43383]|uniref:DNA-binding transcriptional LysR family regulator n=1 Tax=Actinomadura pelletieri DSM 43383 TaxID=1120940 RepID=A0A495QI40_9ACTN|nr:LysR family transcriptional regulator [Actinomadura pelletieri]RKS71809.1 DNA-binding transcriptional LysR family regulator [Actinomadura pelletieri DSM 43383]
MIDVRRLHVLRAVQQYGSVTAAASALHLTVSAVSQQLHSLGDDVGAELVRREGRHAVLTPAAYVLLRHGGEIYAQWERAEAELAALREGSGGPLRLGAFPTALAALVAPAARELRRAHAELSLELVEAESSECFDLLLSRSIDIGIVVPLPDDPTRHDERFEQEALVDDVQDLIVPAGHRLAGGGPVELADAAEETFVAAPGSIDQHQLILAACQAAGFVPRVGHRAQEWNAIVSLVGAGFGVSLMPRLAPVRADAGVVRVPLRGAPLPRRRLLTCVRRGSGARPAVAAGLAALHEAAARASHGQRM